MKRKIYLHKVLESWLLQDFAFHSFLIVFLIFTYRRWNVINIVHEGLVSEVLQALIKKQECGQKE